MRAWTGALPFPGDGGKKDERPQDGVSCGTLVLFADGGSPCSLPWSVGAAGLWSVCYAVCGVQIMVRVSVAREVVQCMQSLASCLRIKISLEDPGGGGKCVCR